MSKTIYILIGPQGSGKTHWATNVLLTQSDTPIIRVSQDEQGKHHHRVFQECIKSGASMVIDRMNFNFEQRDRYSHLASENGYKIIFVWFNVGKETCLRRLATRKGHPTVAHDVDHNDMLDFYFREFEQPRCSEYDELLTIGEKGRCSILDLRNRCCGKRVIVVGDIHGCFDEFAALLAKCEYRVDDIVVATGDLVDRGRKVRETLRWFRNTPGAYSVEGNHDNKYKRYLIGNPVKIANGLGCTLEQCEDLNPTSWAAWLQSLPQMIRLCDINKKPMYVVHAGVDGRRPVEKQRIETCLYVRNLDGKDFFDEKGTPWWETLTGDYIVVSGHIISENAHPNESTYCLDGGACEGGVLRAFVIENGECNVVEVNCDDMP